MVPFDGIFGEIRFIAGNSTPSANWDFCQGRLLAINQNTGLFGAFGTTYGGNGTYNFALPDLRARVAIGKGQGASLSNYELGQPGGSSIINYYINNLPAHSHELVIKSNSDVADKDDPAGNFPARTNFHSSYSVFSNANMAPNSLLVDVFQAGGSQPQINVQPYLGINHIVAVNGTVIPEYTPYIGEIKLTASLTIPAGWLECDGRMVLKSLFPALYVVLGTRFGGDGTFFGLPDLRGRVPIGRSDAIPLGQTGGTENEMINMDMMTAHNHSSTFRLQVFSGIGNSTTPLNNYPAINPRRGYEFSSENFAPIDLFSVTTAFVGTGEPVNNMQPYLTLRYLISTTGVMPF